MFTQFVQKMTKWLPGEQRTAMELLEDPWLDAEYDGD